MKILYGLRNTEIATQKYEKKLWDCVLFWLNCAGDLSSFWKTTTNLGSKISVEPALVWAKDSRFPTAHPHPETPKVTQGAAVAHV